MHCPRCAAEYRDGFATCADCGVALVAAADVVGPRARVGRFHPAIADVVEDLARRRGVPVEREEAGARAELHVPAAQRDDLRAELALAWPSIVAALPEDDAADVRLAGGPMPGWDDAPRGAWVDRDGRLRVASDADEERAADEARALGPTLLVVGVLLLLLAWYADGDGFRLVAGTAGGAMILTGFFLPR